MNQKIAAGSFFYHKGSQTFQRLNIDYQKSIDDNQVIFCSKWGVDRLEDAFILNSVPEGVSLYVPLKVNL